MSSRYNLRELSPEERDLDALMRERADSLAVEREALLAEKELRIAELEEALKDIMSVFRDDDKVMHIAQHRIDHARMVLDRNTDGREAHDE